MKSIDIQMAVEDQVAAVEPEPEVVGMAIITTTINITIIIWPPKVNLGIGEVKREFQDGPPHQQGQLRQQPQVVEQLQPEAEIYF